MKFACPQPAGIIIVHLPEPHDRARRVTQLSSLDVRDRWGGGESRAGGQGPHSPRRGPFLLWSCVLEGDRWPLVIAAIGGLSGSVALTLAICMPSRVVYVESFEDTTSQSDRSGSSMRASQSSSTVVVRPIRSGAAARVSSAFRRSSTETSALRRRNRVHRDRGDRRWRRDR